MSGMSPIEAHSGLAPVLVIIAAAATREFVGWLIQGMGVTATLAATWRQALTSTTSAPSCIVADLDDVADKLSGVAVLPQTCGDDVPLIVLSHHPDLAAKTCHSEWWTA